MSKRQATHSSATMMRFLYNLVIAGFLIAANSAVAQDFRSTLSPPAWVLPNAALDLDFAHQRYWNHGLPFDPITTLTTTRSTAAACTTSSGSITTVAAGIPCITDLGLQ